MIRAFGIVASYVLLVIGGGAAWCERAYPIYTYRYQMTVEVVVGGMVRSGSSVIEVEIRSVPNLLDNPTFVPRVRGEAVFVDLGNGLNVIALLASGRNGSNVDYPFRIVPQLFSISYSESDRPKLASLRGHRDVPEPYLPTFVTFANLNDPKTARIVRPDEFEQALGSGVRFKATWIEMTDQPVTTGIKNKISWIGKYPIETDFERVLRAADDGKGSSMTPGMNLKRGD